MHYLVKVRLLKVKGDGNEEMRGKFGRILGDFRTLQGDLLTSNLWQRVTLLFLVVTRKDSLNI